MTYQTIDPYTGQLVQTYDYLDAAQIEKALQDSHEAFATFKTTPLALRAELLLRVADDLEANGNRYAEVMKLEMGKPIAEGEAECRKSALACRYYAEHGAAFLTNEPRATEASQTFICKDPLGVILAIMPWNFPFWQLFRVAAPNLMAGNVILLKHATNTPQCALEIEAIFARAQSVKGVVQSVFVTHDNIADIIADRRIKGVTLTGSERAGRSVGALAGAHLKPCVLELGGCDPFIVFDDADLQRAASTAATARCLNSGQSCIAAKRFLIHRKVEKAFTDALVQAMQNDVKIGPQATHQQRQTLHEQVLDAQSKGATALCGGALPEGPGFYYPATVITNVNPSMRIYSEETFGPLATLLTFDSDDEALALANGTNFGLGAGVWTTNPERIARFARELECGAVFFNEMVKSDPRLPFGGVKDSGFGRELSHEGMLSFVNLKTVWIK